MKKILKVLGISILIIATLLIAIPFAFQGQIKDMVKVFINQNLNAKVEFSDISLSFIKSFPQAQVAVNDLLITNFEPFKDETFASVKDVTFTMSIKELFKKPSEGPVVVNSIYVNEALLTLKNDKFGNSNYNIIKEDNNNASADKETSSLGFDIEDYQIKNSALTYIDDPSKTIMHITNLNHEGHGAFSTNTSELDTKSEANVSFNIDSINYLINNKVKLDAVIGMDLSHSKYTFKQNKAFINELPLHFDGFVKLLENGQDIDITFENPESDFKNFLAVIPKEYSKNLDGIKTSGLFKVKGAVKGKVTETTIPKLDITITSKNASFKYPNLPKGVEHITINAAIKNTTGNVDDTFIDVKTLDFKIDDDVFKSSAIIKNIAKNMFVNAHIDGVLNLANITKAYPLELENTLTGILKAKLNTSFDMNAIDTNDYERIKNSGSASISDFVFSSEDIVNPIHISTANVSFKPKKVSLNNFTAKTGESDLSADGTIDNLLGFLLSDAKLKGNFDVNSNLFKVSDFMSENDEKAADNKTTSDSESLKIPKFLDCSINANAKTVIYDNLNLNDVKGKLLIKDQQAVLQNMTSSIFDGALSISGNISTKEATPTFNMNLGADGFDISKSFKGLDLLQNLAPIAKLLQGKLNTDINVSGDLDKEFSPNLSSVSGKAIGELLTTSIAKNESELFNKLESALGFIDFSKLDLKDLKTKLEFANGKVSVNPFDLKYEDIAITISGVHGFDKTVNYDAVFNVPAKYLGSEVNRLIGKINSNETKNISIPVTANIGGTYTSPTVKTDLTSGISNLTKQLIEIEKQRLLNKGKDKVSDLIDDVISGNKTKTDSVKQQQQNKVVKDVLGSIIGGGKKTDSTTTNDTSNTVKNVLGGLLRSKKKRKDSIK